MPEKFESQPNPEKEPLERKWIENAEGVFELKQTKTETSDSDFKTMFDRVIGGKSEEERIGAKEDLQKRLEQPIRADIKEHEIPLTERDRKIIKSTESAVDKIVTYYGGKPKRIKPENIGVVSQGAIATITEGRLRGGMYSSLGQKVIVEKNESDVDLATVLAHELFHFKAYKSAKITKEGDIKSYRSGIAVSDREKEVEYLVEIEEAIIAKVVRKFYEEEIRNNPLFADEVLKTDKVKDWIKKSMQMRDWDENKSQFMLDEIYSMPESDKMLEVLEKKDFKGYKGKNLEEFKIGYVDGCLKRLIEKDKVVLSERYREREKLNKIMQEILEKSKGKFKDKKEIFDEFTKAHFSGNLLPLARIVESALGKGSFRKMAEDSKRE